MGKDTIFLMVNGFRVSLKEFEERDGGLFKTGTDYQALGAIQDVLMNTSLPAEQINHASREILERLEDLGYRRGGAK